MLAHCELRNNKILLDLSGNPVREMQFVAVLSAMVKAAIAQGTKASEVDAPEPTTHGPGHELRPVAAASTP